jgi:hypothetical protein
LSYDTFRSWIRVMGLSLEGKNTHMENNIPIETRIAMGLA